MNRKVFLLVGIVAICLIVLLGGQKEKVPSALQIGDTIIKVEIADTEMEQAQGLSGRESLPTNMGLLFIFEKSGKYGFWMKDMRFPIDIAWLDSDYKIVYIETSLSPATYPKVFYPQTEARYVLEVNAGFLASHNLVVGEVLETKGN